MDEATLKDLLRINNTQPNWTAQGLRALGRNPQPFQAQGHPFYNNGQMMAQPNQAEQLLASGQQQQTSQYGKRLGNNGQKGSGFFGLMKRPDGNISTELSVGVEMNGEEVLIPSLVPTLTQDEINQVLSNTGVPQPSIVAKAADYARMRMSQGLSPFWQEGEQVYQGEYEY